MSGLLIFLFLSIFAAILVAVAVGVNVLEAQRQRQMKSVLTTLSTESEQSEAPIILVDQSQDGSKPLQEFLSFLNVADYLDGRLAQSGLGWTSGRLIGMMVLGAAAGAFLGYEFNLLLFQTFSVIFFAGALGWAPMVYVLNKRRARMNEFEEQFPEALDFIARAMRSGHAFSVSLEMLGTESPEPLGREFRTLFNEHNLGAPIEVALGNLVQRIPLLDVRFFVSIVRLQRQTGGNLSEILTRLSYLIRERFRLKGQVKAASAHGRLTAGVLTVLPVITMLALRVVAPGYLKSMAADSDGKYLIVAAVIAQLTGFFIMKKIINIKV
jgi:tight adherence protein B